MSNIKLLILTSFSLLPTMITAQYTKSTCIKSITNPWLKALCHTLESQKCDGRCTGNPTNLDCSCKI